jgi:hypothetical protein
MRMYQHEWEGTDGEMVRVLGERERERERETAADSSR